jgi:hypothetical protein
MKPEEEDCGPAKEGNPQPHRVRLPGFLAEHDIGLGDVFGKAARYVGLRPCGGCAHRAAALNRWFVVSGRRSG